jgi:hypothetical protein
LRRCSLPTPRALGQGDRAHGEHLQWHASQAPVAPAQAPVARANSARRAIAARSWETPAFSGGVMVSAARPRAHGQAARAPSRGTSWIGMAAMDDVRSRSDRRSGQCPDPRPPPQLRRCGRGALIRWRGGAIFNGTVAETSYRRDAPARASRCVSRAHQAA